MSKIVGVRVPPSAPPQKISFVFVDVFGLKAPTLRLGEGLGVAVLVRDSFSIAPAASLVRFADFV